MAYDRSEWELSEFGNLIETENEKYGEIVQIAERKRTAEKYVKIRKIRQEMTWGVRLTKTLIICYCGPYVAYKESILAELVPPFQFYLRDTEFYTTYTGTPFRLPDRYKFKFYENAVECWHHNAILSNKKQLNILVRYNFEKFVRALETIGEPTAAKIQYDYHTCVSSISPFSESENEESETDDEDDRSEGEEQDHSINKIFPFSFSGDEESESDDEDDRSEGEEQDHSINKIFPDEEEEHDQSDDDLPMITPYSESENGESESYYGSDEQSEEEEQDHHSDEITEDKEEMYFAKEEDNDKKFDSEDVPNLQLLHCREEVGHKSDPEESDLGILFGAEENNHNLDLEKVGSLSSLEEKVEQDDVLDSENVSNKDQFNEIEVQGPFNQEQQQQQQQQQQHCSEHMVEHRPIKNTKKRKNILMGWVCSKILKVFVKSKVLL